MSWTQTLQYFLPSQSSVRIISSHLQNLPQSVPDLSSLTANTCNTGESMSLSMGNQSEVRGHSSTRDLWADMARSVPPPSSPTSPDVGLASTERHTVSHALTSLSELYNNDLTKPLLLGAFAHPQMTEHLHCAWWSLFLFIKSCSSFA